MFSTRRYPALLLTTIVATALIIMIRPASAQSLPDIRPPVATAPAVGIEPFTTRTLPDLDMDALPEVLVRSTLSLFGETLQNDFVVSSGTGLPLWSLPLLPLGVQSSLIRAGDQNADGSPEFVHIVGDTVSILDGSTGTTLNALNIAQYFGVGTLEALEVFPLVDLTGDGVDDIAIAATIPNMATIPTNTRYWTIFSGADFSFVFSYADTFPFEVEGAGSLGDVNRDGVEDVYFWLPGTSLGQILVLSGLDLQIIHALPSPANVTNERLIARSPADLDGDGRDDILVAFSEMASTALPALRLHDGASGSEVWTTTGYRLVEDLPSLDWNADGTFDLVVLDPASIPVTHLVLSGADGSIIPGSTFSPAVQGTLLPDVNGDGWFDRLVVSAATPGLPGSGPVAIAISTSAGAEAYGAGTAGRELSWSLDAPLNRGGTLTLEGGSPNAAAILGVSLTPGGGVIAGTTLPLFISATAPDLLLQESLVLGPNGDLQVPVALMQPALAGTSLYLQWAEVAPALEVSNGLQLYFSG